MNRVVLDFETYYSKDFTLSKMTTQEYIADPRFQVIGMGIRWPDDQHSTWHTGASMERQLSHLATHQGSVLQVAHNGVFDHSILGHRYGIHPMGLACTMGMANALGLGLSVGGSLSALTEAFRSAGYPLAPKGNEVVAAMGKRLEDFTPAELAAYGRYCCTDTDNCGVFFDTLAPMLGPDEMLWQSQVLRMHTNPRLRIDGAVVQAELERVKVRRAAAIERMRQRLGLPSFDDEALRALAASRTKLVELLELFGVVVPTKISPTTGKPTPALSKKDTEFLALLEHPDDMVRALVEARLEMASNIEQSRCLQMLRLAALPRFAAPFKISGAHTHRLGGADGVNCLDGEHEILTPSGWVKLGTWGGDTPVMQWWPDGSMTWCSSPGLVRVESSEMVEVNGPVVRARMTPNHRVVFTSKRGISERPASDLLALAHQDGIPTTGAFVGGAGAITVAQARLIVAASADGYESQRGTLCFGFRKARKIERLRALLADAGVPCTERDYRPTNAYQFIVSADDVKANPWLRKGYGPWILGLQHDALHAAADEVRWWDGSSNSRSLQDTFHTIHRDQAEWVQTLWHLAGRCASLLEYEAPETTTGKTFHVYHRKSVTTSVHRKHVSLGAGGSAFCPQTDSSYIITRYRDRIHITGQCQNFPSGRKPGQSDALKRSIIPLNPDEVYIGADSSQIEVRVLDYCADDWKGLENFRNGICPYSDMATRMWPTDGVDAALVKKLAKAEDEIWAPRRQIAKAVVLACGFGQGGPGFRDYAETQAGLVFTVEEATGYVHQYREAKPRVVAFWRRCDRVLQAMINGEQGHFGGPDGKLFYFDGQRTVIGRHIPGIRLPNGTWLSYPDLRNTKVKEVDEETGEVTWRNVVCYSNAKGRTTETVFTWGGTLTENLVQALAFAVMKWQAGGDTVTRYGLVLNCHDAHAVLAARADAIEVKASLLADMSECPPWVPGLPLGAEADIAETMAGVI